MFCKAAACIFLISAVPVFSQSSHIITVSTPTIQNIDTASDQTLSEANSDWMNNFYSGVGFLSKSGFVGELAMSAKRFEIFLGRSKRTIKVKTDSSSTKDYSKTRDLILGFSILNRATVSFDSLQYIANNYLLSLNPSPFTIRLDYLIPFAPDKEISVVEKNTPNIDLILQADARAIPFAGTNGSVDVGGSFHLFATFSLTATSYVKKDSAAQSRIIDEGNFYFEPTFYLITTSSLLGQSILQNKNTLIYGIDFKVGFKSHKSSVNDWGLSGYYTWDDVIGPKFRLGVIIKPK